MKVIMSTNPTGVNEIWDTTPDEFSLSQNYPNPFNPNTKIKFTIKEKGLVNSKVYDILGREISTLVNDVKSQGLYDVDFNAAGLSSGIYFYSLQSGSNVESKKMILIK